MSAETGAPAPPAAGGESLYDSDDMAEYLVENGIESPVADAVTDLLDREFALGNISNEDRRYARLMAENVVLLLEEQYPPTDSQLQGSKRAAYLNDVTEQSTAIGESTKTQLRTLLLAAFFRTSRSVDGWQQDKLSESITTQRREDLNTDEDDSGLFSIFS